jgi:hypothetical protein
MGKLDVKALGLSLGITWGASVLLIAWLAWLTGFGLDIITWLGKFYLGSGASFLGGIIGGIWGFIDGGIGGVVIAWLYNKFTK